MKTHILYRKRIKKTKMAPKCVSCRVQFESPVDHRAHFQSEWHCYNLKRKIASLPPLTNEEFDERKQLAAKQENAKGKSDILLKL